MDSFKNPAPTVDAVIFWRDTNHIVLIERKNPPYGWALPGGFVNEGESLEDAVKREVAEELEINIIVVEQFFTYSKPNRDPRKHVMTTVFIAYATETPRAADDAAFAKVFDLRESPPMMAFDHARIIDDVVRYVNHGEPRRKLEE